MANEQQQRAILELVGKSMQGTHVQEATRAIQHAQTQPGFGIGLLSTVANKSIESPLRQQSGILLKHMIGTHWEQDPLKVNEPQSVMNEDEKNAIRNMILDRGLVGDENSKIRLTIAMIIGNITSTEQNVEKWPQLLETLVGYIRESMEQRNLFLLEGAIFTMNVYIENVPEEMLPNFTVDLFQLLFPIANEPSVGVDIRSKCLGIYDHIIGELITLSGAHEQIIEQLVLPSLMQWMQTFDGILSVGDVSMFSLQNDVVLMMLKFVSDIDVKKVSKLIGEQLGGVLEKLWACIQLGIETRNNLCILSDPFNQDPTQSKTKDMVELFLGNSFMFFERVMTHSRPAISRQMMDKLSDVSNAMITLLMLSHDDVTRYQFEPSEYATSEDDIYKVDNLRTSIRNVIGRMLDTYHKPGFHALLNAAKHHLEESSTKARQSKSPNEMTWAWRQREAAVLAFQFIGDEIGDVTNGVSDLGSFNPVDFVAQVLGPDFDGLSGGKPVSNDTELTAVTFLGCRALWCSSHFAEVLPTTVRQQLLGTIICSCLGETQSVPVRLAAVKSFDRIAQNIAKEETRGFVPQILPLLCRLLESNITENDTTYMTIDAIHTCIKLDAKTACELNESIVQFLLTLWEKNVEDEEVSSRVSDIVATLCTYPCINQARAKCFPVCMTILETCSKESQPNFGIAMDAVSLLQVLVDPTSRSNADEMISVASLSAEMQALVKDMPPDVYTAVVPGILQMVLNLDTHQSTTNPRDQRLNEMLKFVCACIDFACCCVRSNPQAFSADIPNGPSCVDLAINVCGKSLSPQENDIVADVACSLVTALSFHLQEQIQSRSQAILLAVLQRLVAAKSKGNSSLIQRLMLIFLRLVGQHGMMILDFCVKTNDGCLDVPQPNPRGGVPQVTRVKTVDFVLKMWIESHNQFYFDYDTKVSLVAMTKLLEQYFQNEDFFKVLNEFVVPGYEIMDLSGPRRTRSRGPIQKRYTDMKFPVKLLNLMVSTFVSASMEGTDLDDEYDSDEESTSVVEELSGRNLDRLANKYGSNGHAPQVEEYMRHMRNAQLDPINSVVITELVCNFVKQMNNGNRQKFEMIAGQLNDDDQQNLRRIIQS